MALDTGIIGVSVLVSTIFNIIVVFLLIKRVAVPVLTAIIVEKTEETQNMMKAAASAMGSRSSEVKGEKKLEKLMIGDIMDKYPELEIALEYFSPDTAEMIRKHPQRALTILARYKPILEEVLGVKADGKLPWQY